MMVVYSSVTGGICGTILVFILPILIHLVANKEKHGEWGYARTTFHIAFLLFGIALSMGQFIPPIVQLFRPTSPTIM
jgi:hypothetical protein